MRHVGLLVTQTHGPDEALVLDGPPGELGPDKRWLCNHALPALLLRLCTRLDNLEHFILGDTLDLWQRHAELGRLFGALLLDGRGKRLGRVGRLAVEKVGGQRLGRWLRRRRRLELLRFVRLERLLELDLFGVPLFGVQFGAETRQVLGIFGDFVALTSNALTPGEGGLVCAPGAVGGGGGDRTCALQNRDWRERDVSRCTRIVDDGGRWGGLCDLPATMLLRPPFDIPKCRASALGSLRWRRNHRQWMAVVVVGRAMAYSFWGYKFRKSSSQHFSILRSSGTTPPSLGQPYHIGDASGG